MGIALPQLAPASEDRVSGAQVIDGCLRFDGSRGQYLKFTPSSTGNRRIQTLSVWIKNTYTGSQNKMILGGGDNPSQARYNIAYSPTKRFGITQNPTGSSNDNAFSVGQFRDYSGWQHLVVQLDCTVGQNSGQVRIYVNGKLQENGDYSGGGSAVYITDQDGIFNTINKRMYLGHYAANPSDPAEFDGYMAQYYWIDGLALGPSYFGYTDPLTNTWRPKKFRAEGTTVNNGTTWSNFSSDPDNVISSGAATALFDGDLSSGGVSLHDTTTASDEWFIALSGVSIPCKHSVSFWSQNGAGTATMRINGDNNLKVEATSTTFGWYTLNFSGTINKIELAYLDGGSSNTYYGLEVDGVLLRDGVTQNLDFGTNGVYLPFDGSAPIGQDQSGKGNDYTPVNFGGSTEISKATGAFPVLNTGQGGSVGRPGVFGSDVGFHETVNSSSGSPNPYIFDDRGTQPVLNFIRGATYIFDYSSATNHPLRFATAADAAGSTEYTDGTSVSGNVISFTVPHNAPNTLYYYCTNHGNMGNSINVTTDITKADPYAWKCVLAMPLVGGSGSDLSSQINATTSAKAVTVTSASDSSLCNFYGSSMNFDGSNDKLDVADSTDFAVDTGDWCAECWFYTPASDSTSKTVFQNNSGSDAQINLGINSLELFAYLGSTQIIFAGDDTAVQAKTWHHIALNHDDSLGTNGTTTLYIDGQARATATTAVPTGNHNGFFLGHNTAHNTRWISANYQDVRFYKGTKKYTGNFIPAAAKPDVLPDSPSGVATKSKLTKITDGAVSFDGNGDYLATYVSSSDFTFGTGDFTIEMFLYNEETGGKGFIQFSDSEGGLKGTSSGVVTIHKDAGVDGVFRAYVKNGSTGFTSKVPYKRWCHVALVRQSGTIKLFVDGKQDATTVTSDTTDYATTYVIVGGYYDSNYLSKCNISNVRVNKGTAVYTKDFTPPTSALTNISGTKLLCCQSNTEPGSAAVGSNVTGVNSGVQWSAGAGPNFEANNPARDGFNGKENSNTRTDNANVTATVILPVPVAFSSSLKVRGARDSGNGTIKLIGGNGTVDVSSQFTSSSASLETVTITGVTSPLKGISLTGISGSAQPRFSAIYIDDAMLVDPLTPSGDVSVSSNTHERSSAATFNPFNTDINTVRGQEGSYVTLNGRDPRLLTTGPTYTLSNGNLTCDMVGGSNYSSGSRGFAASTIDLPNGGKWYCEYYMDSLGNDDIALGIAADDVLGYYIASGTPKPGAYMLRSSGIVYYPTGQLTSSSSRAYVTGDLVGVAVDLVDYKITFYKNGRIVYSHSVDPGQGPYKFVIGCDPGGSTAYKTTVNFGQKPFKFSPPDGFQPLTSATVMPDTVINRSKKYFSTTLYTGNGASTPGGSGGTQTIDAGLKPDLVWIKDRTQAHNNNLIDSINGAPKLLMSDQLHELVTDSTDGLTAFDDKGFNLGDNGAGTQSLEMNKSGNDYVAWAWKAGGNKGTFNIDDVDVGSAANANMSVGSLNSSAYNKTQTWSNAMSGSIYSGQSFATLFNGSVNGIHSAANSTITLTLPTPLSGNLKIWMARGSGSSTAGSNYDIKINGISVFRDDRLPDNANATVDFGYWDSIETIEWGSGSIGGDWIQFNRIYIDGAELVDNGTSTSDAPSIANIGASVGTKQGFSIIKYAGSGSTGTIAHGLNQAPDFFFGRDLEDTSDARDWIIYHKSIGGAGRLKFTSDGTSSSNAFFQNIGTMKKLIHVGNSSDINSTNDYILYCWHDVPGLQKFGTYAGNNLSSTSGPFIELGFRPSMIMLKKIDNTDSNSGWHMYDNQRNTYNPANNFLLASHGYVENRAANNTATVTTYTVDFYSTGFKFVHDSNNLNVSGSNYIYCAWAETPSFNLFGATANAR